ncbi:MAG: 2-oxo acid dehydrogenase subunit E2 [Gemmataceae bacterium]|nr:2-oxo acid dehydrogenase subunit E2 [Gemmataceae bacterium]MCI0738354.1 2-oxo acid dehydrogenase subunit E2 [Gemmataceae bacterium]
MRGKPIPLSPMRRFTCDLLRAARAVPTVPVQRRMHLAKLAAARAAHPQRIPWVAIFTKALAKVAAEMPQLRRAYVKFPWPHLYEFPESVASIAIEREYAGEHAVLYGRIKAPAHRPLTELAQIIRDLQQVPVEQSKALRRVLWLGRLPWPLRRLLWWLGLNIGRQRANFLGTFGVSVYSGLGAESLHPISPLTTTLNYGVIAADGAVDVRLCYDHRVMDGANVARALERTEVELHGELLAELRSTSRQNQVKPSAQTLSI